MVVAAFVFACGLGLMLIPPAGCNAIPLAVACLWRWPPPLQAWLNARLRLGRRALDVVGVGLATVAAVVSLATGGQLDGHLLHGGDFQSYWLGAIVGARYGWSRLFDEGLQRSVWPGLAGPDMTFLPFLNTPPMAWLVAPLLHIPYVDAYALWVSVMVLCAVVVLVLLVPRRWLPAAGLVALGLWVIPYTLASGENAVLGALAIAATWKLLRAGRMGWAGLALSLIALRPNATLLVPLALLLAGYRRTFVVWIAVTAALAGAIVWSLGITGVGQFLHLALEIRITHPRAQEMTILGLLGAGAPALALEAVLAAAALSVAWRFGRVPEVALAAGVLASMFVTPYIHHQDYLTLIVAAVAIAVATVRASFGLILIAVFAAAPPGWIYDGAWEGVLLSVEVAWLGWLAWPWLAKLRAVGVGAREPPAPA